MKKMYCIDLWKFIYDRNLLDLWFVVEVFEVFFCFKLGFWNCVLFLVVNLVLEEVIWVFFLCVRIEMMFNGVYGILENLSFVGFIFNLDKISLIFGFCFIYFFMFSFIVYINLRFCKKLI